MAKFMALIVLRFWLAARIMGTAMLKHLNTLVTCAELRARGKSSANGSDDNEALFQLVTTRLRCIKNNALECNDAVVM